MAAAAVAAAAAAQCSGQPVHEERRMAAAAVVAAAAARGSGSGRGKVQRPACARRAANGYSGSGRCGGGQMYWTTLRALLRSMLVSWAAFGPGSWISWTGWQMIMRGGWTSWA